MLATKESGIGVRLRVRVWHQSVVVLLITREISLIGLIAMLCWLLASVVWHVVGCFPAAGNSNPWALSGWLMVALMARRWCSHLSGLVQSLVVMPQAGYVVSWGVTPCKGFNCFTCMPSFSSNPNLMLIQYFIYLYRLISKLRSFI